MNYIKGFTDRLFWALLLGVCTFATREISKLSENVASLNEKMAVALYEFDAQKESNKVFRENLKELTMRVDHMESARTRR